MTGPRKEKIIEMKKKNKSPYLQTYDNLKNDLFMLKELNKHLPRSINHILDKRERKLMDKAGKLDKRSKAEFEEAANALGEVLKWEKSKKPGKKTRSVSFSVSDKTWKFVGELVNMMGLWWGFNKFIREMSLVYLIAEFESFLESILKISFQKKPAILASCQKSITFEELAKFKDMNDAKQQIMEKEVSSIINRDIEDINRYFEQKFNTELSQFTNWKKFKERFYRRNIIIHRSGRTDKIYRLKSGYKGKDKQITVSQNYLKDSIKLLGNMGLKISEHFYNKFK